QHVAAHHHIGVDAMRCVIVALALLLIMPGRAYAFVPAEDRPRVAPKATPPVQMPAGPYRVTEAYVADIITRSGDLTSYSTATQHHVTDTFARVLDRVGTGARSTYDGAAFNGRTSLAGGALVAGTYYENYIFDGSAYR